MLCKKIKTTTKEKDKQSSDQCSDLSFSTDIHYTPKILLHIVAEYCSLGNSENEM